MKNKRLIILFVLFIMLLILYVTVGIIYEIPLMMNS